MKQLSTAEASFVFLETPRAPMTVGGVACYRSDPGRNKPLRALVRETLDARLHLAPALRRRLVRVPLNLDDPYWLEDPDFDLDYHIEHIALPQPADRPMAMEQIGRFLSRPLDMARPPWQVLVVEGLEDVEGFPSDGFLLVWKLHQALIDREEGTGLTGALNDMSPDSDVPPPDTPWRPERMPNLTELASLTSLNNFRFPFKFARVLAQSTPALAQIGAGLEVGRLYRAGPVPKTRFGGKVSPARAVGMVKFDSMDLERIAASVDGADTEAVLLSIIGSALRAQLEEWEERPPEPLIALVPTPAVPDDGPAGKPKLAPITVSLRTGMGDPIERLRGIARSMKRAHEREKALSFADLPETTLGHPGAFAEIAAQYAARVAIANQVTPLFNTVLIESPAPEVPLYLGDREMLDLFGFPQVTDGVGLVHQATSYAGSVALSFAACAKMLPSQERYCQYLKQAFADLKGAMGEAKAQTPRHAPPAKPKAPKKSKLVPAGDAFSAPTEAPEPSTQPEAAFEAPLPEAAGEIPANPPTPPLRPNAPERQFLRTEKPRKVKKAKLSDKKAKKAAAAGKKSKKAKKPGTPTADSYLTAMSPAGHRNKLRRT